MDVAAEAVLAKAVGWRSAPGTKIETPGCPVPLMSSGACLRRAASRARPVGQ
jgi:hypothetical protein